MQTYLTMLYVTLEQEVALKEYFISKGWSYSKPDLNVVTDRVGPFCSPKALKTDSGNIITFNEMSTNDTNDKPTEARSKIVKKRDKNVTRSAVVPDVIKVQVSPEGQECLDGYGSDDADKSLENDDGDNDDDYADDINNKTEEMEENIAGDNLSPKNPGRPVRNSHKASIMNLDTVQEKSGSEQEGTSVTPSGRKRRKVAARAEATIQSVMSEEKDETDVKPSLNVNTSARREREKKPPPGVKQKCSLCPKEFMYQYTLNNHYKLCHNPDNPPKSKPKKKHYPQQCDICGKVYTRSSNLLDHKKQVHMGLTKKRKVDTCTCDYCGITYKRSAHLKEHILVKHSDSKLQHPCKLCDKSFVRFRFLENHLNRDHLKVKPFKCDFCGKTFFSEYSVNKHIKMRICQPNRVDRFKCLQCDLRYQTANHLEMHMTAKHFGGAYSCVCGEVVQWSGSVAKHKRRCQAYQAYIKATGNNEDKVCNVIKVKFEDVSIAENDKHDTSKNSSLLVNKQHLRQLLTEALRSSKTRKESSKMDFATCPQCKKHIRNTNVRRHLLLHFDLPYRCTRCSSYYTSQEELEKHRLEKHMGEFICSYCGLKYRFKNSLTEHIQTRHEGTAKMYQCTVCGVKMCRKSHMDDHMNIHNDVNPYSCQKCSKSYKNKSAFKRHMKDCGSGVKHVCSVCGQIYKSSVGLQDHMRRCHDDTNGYLFSCVCKASFKTRAARCRHRVHCDIYQNEKNVIQSHSVQQNVTILSVTSSDVQNFYRENSLLSNADQGIRNDDIVQNAGYELVEVSPDDVNVINVTDALEQGEIVASGETFNEISEPSHTFE